MGSWKVVAPYVTLKIKDLTGSSVVQGFYAGGIVDAADDEQAQAQANLGLLERFTPESDEAPVVVPDPPADDVPKGNASREDWAVYAAIKGAPNEETRPVDEGGLTQTKLREKYGN